MAQLSANATSATQTAGTWTNPTNAQGADNATFAAWTSTTRSATATLTGGGFTFASIPAGSTINFVTVRVKGYSSVAAAPISSITSQLFDGTTAIGTATTHTLSTTTTNVYATFNVTGVTLAQVQAGNLQVQHKATRTNSTTSATVNVDSFQITVDYTPPLITGSASPSGDGTLTATGVPLVAGSASPSGDGTLTATGTPTPAITLTQDGSGTLGVVPSADVGLSGSGDLTASGTASVMKSVAVGASGTLTAGQRVEGFVDDCTSLAAWNYTTGDLFSIANGNLRLTSDGTTPALGNAKYPAAPGWVTPDSYIVFEIGNWNLTSGSAQFGVVSNANTQVAGFSFNANLNSWSTKISNVSSGFTALSGVAWLALRQVGNTAYYFQSTDGDTWAFIRSMSAPISQSGSVFLAWQSAPPAGQYFEIAGVNTGYTRLPWNVSLDGTGTLTAATNEMVSLSGASALTASGSPGVVATASQSGYGATTYTATLTVSGVAATTGDSLLYSNTQTQFATTTVAAGVGTTAAVARMDLPATVPIQPGSDGTLSATGVPTPGISLDLAGSGELTVVGTPHMFSNSMWGDAQFSPELARLRAGPPISTLVEDFVDPAIRTDFDGTDSWYWWTDAATWSVANGRFEVTLPGGGHDATLDPQYPSSDINGDYRNYSALGDPLIFQMGVSSGPGDVSLKWFGKWITFSATETVVRQSGSAGIIWSQPSVGTDIWVRLSYDSGSNQTQFALLEGGAWVDKYGWPCEGPVDHPTFAFSNYGETETTAWVDSINVDGPSLSSPVEVSGAGSLAAVGSSSFSDSVALSGAGAVTSTATVNLPVAGQVGGTGSLAVSTSIQISTATTVTGTGMLAATGTPVVPAIQAYLTGAGDLTGAGVSSSIGTAVLTGTGELRAKRASFVGWGIPL